VPDNLKSDQRKQELYGILFAAWMLSALHNSFERDIARAAFASDILYYMKEDA
jgi:hypothetical protein